MEEIAIHTRKAPFNDNDVSMLQGGYSPTGNVSEMYGSIGNYSAYAPHGGNNTLGGYGHSGAPGWRENQQQMT